MVQEIAPILPQSISSVAMALCIVGMLLGWVLWAVGAAASRWIVTWLAVAFGGFAGMMLPRWYIWPVNSMSTAVLGAVGLGVLAFVIPRLFVGLTLGAALVAWSFLGTWMLLRGDAQFVVRADWQVETMTPPEHAQDIWQRLPETVRRVVPYSTSTAMISGLALTLLWPRIGRLLMASTWGVTMIFVCGLILVYTQRPEWLRFVPEPKGAQAAILSGMVILGALIQWQLLPTRREVQMPEVQQPEMA
jgi:hypothetical protein